MRLTTKPSGLDLQGRDFALLRGLFESRVMTAGHIAPLYFDGKAEATKKRLQKLKAAGLIVERPRRAYHPSVLFLSAKAFRLLSEQGKLAGYPKYSAGALAKRAQVSELTLRHELEVMDVKTALVMAVAATPRCKIAEFSTWPVLYQFRARRSNRAAEMIVKPDGFIRIDEEIQNGGADEHCFFLEVDRSQETQDILADKAARYLDYYHSGGFAVRFGQPPTAFKEYPFRVLMVFKNAERRNNTADRLLRNNPPIFTHTWLTTMSELLADPLGPVWIRPLDYREVTKGTPFDTAEGWADRRGYRRQTDREALVEGKITKSKLLE